MLDGVGGHVDNTDVVTVHQCSVAKRGVELQEELAQPCSFCNSISHSAILSFSTRPRDGVLTLGGPGDEVVTEEHNIGPRWTCVYPGNQPNQHQCRPQDQSL